MDLREIFKRASDLFEGIFAFHEATGLPLPCSPIRDLASILAQQLCFSLYH